MQVNLSDPINDERTRHFYRVEFKGRSSVNDTTQFELLVLQAKGQNCDNFMFN